VFIFGAAEENRQRPSVNVLFRSAAVAYGPPDQAAPHLHVRRMTPIAAWGIGTAAERNKTLTDGRWRFSFRPAPKMNTANLRQ